MGKEKAVTFLGEHVSLEILSPIRKVLHGIQNHIVAKRKLVSLLTEEEISFIEIEEETLRKRTHTVGSDCERNKESLNLYISNQNKQAKAWLSHPSIYIKAVMEDRLPFWYPELSLPVMFEMPASLILEWGASSNVFRYKADESVEAFQNLPHLANELKIGFILSLWGEAYLECPSLVRNLTLGFLRNTKNGLPEKLLASDAATNFMIYQIPDLKNIVTFLDIRRETLTQIKEKYGLDDFPDSWIVEMFK